MRGTILTAALAAAVFAMASPGQRAVAMPAATPTQLAQADGGLLQKAAVVCGYYGCRRVWPGYYGPGPYWGPRPYWGYYRHPYWGHPYWGGRRWRRW